MSPQLNSQSSPGLFGGKARTVAAVAAFSGLALATAVSVEATQNPSEQASATAATQGTIKAQPAGAMASSIPTTASFRAPMAAPAKKPATAKDPVRPTSKTDAPVSQAVDTSVAQGRHTAPVNHETQVLEAAAARAVGAQYEGPAVQAAEPVPQAPPTVETPAVQAAEPVAVAPVTQAPAAQAPATPVAPVAAPVSKPVAQAAPAKDPAPAVEAPAAQVPAPASAPTDQAPAVESEVRTVSTKAPAAQPAASQGGQAILNAAQAQLGETQDCTQLVSDALKAVGINHYGWPGSYKQLGTMVSASEAKAGDVVYYADAGAGVPHVAIYAGDGQAIHGGWNGNQTVKTTVNLGSGPQFIRVG